MWGRGPLQVKAQAGAEAETRQPGSLGSNRAGEREQVPGEMGKQSGTRVWDIPQVGGGKVPLQVTKLMVLVIQ